MPISYIFIVILNINKSQFKSKTSYAIFIFHCLPSRRDDNAKGFENLNRFMHFAINVKSHTHPYIRNGLMLNVHMDDDNNNEYMVDGCLWIFGCIYVVFHKKTL